MGEAPVALPGGHLGDSLCVPFPSLPVARLLPFTPPAFHACSLGLSPNNRTQSFLSGSLSRGIQAKVVYTEAIKFKWEG